MFLNSPILLGWIWDHYAPTLSMPTYLIAVVVSDFTYDEAPLDLMRGKASRVWAAPPLMTDGAGVYGAETSAKVITFFEDHFNATYDFPKLDSGAIPDFSAGAMENWGLVLYRYDMII